MDGRTGLARLGAGPGDPRGEHPCSPCTSCFEQTGTASAVAVVRDAKLEPEKVNPYGGAIALGRPVGGTGAIRSGASRAAAAPSPKKGLIGR